MDQIFEQTVKDELKSMDQRLIEMEQKMNSIYTKLTQVVDAILGNPLTKSGGFVRDVESINKRIEELEKKIESLEDLKKKFLWTLGIATFIILVVKYVISLYISLK